MSYIAVGNKSFIASSFITGFFILLIFK